MRFVAYESQTPRFALYGPTKNKEIVKSVRGLSSDTLKLCDLLANIDIELLADSCRRLTLQPYKASKHVTFNWMSNFKTRQPMGAPSNTLLKLDSQWKHRPKYGRRA